MKQENKWISVKHSLPKNGESVWLYNGFRVYFIESCDTNVWSIVSHWMLGNADESAPEAPAHDPTGTEAQVCFDIAERQKKGIQKYGQTLSENPLKLEEWLQHAYEECLDQAVYLKRAIEDLKK